MNSDKFSHNFNLVLKASRYVAQQNSDKEIGNGHILEALQIVQGSIAFELMHRLGLVSLPERLVSHSHKTANDRAHKTVVFSHASKKVIQNAILIAARFGHKYIGTEHLLLSLTMLDKQLLHRIFKGSNLSTDNLYHQLEAVLNNTAKLDMLTAEFLPQERIHKRNTTGIPPKEDRNKKRKSNTSERILDYFAVDITHEKHHSHSKPIVGRDNEIERVIQILARRDKNNPVLIGEPGVGKTAIVEGLAQRISAGSVPEALFHKKIFNLDMSLIVAGATYRGEFESRLKQLLDEIQEDPNIIIFIDELHTMVGAGSAGGSMDAANILKPALARGDVRLIGATTFNEYKQYIEPDAALERRLQTIVVAEPAAKESINILHGIKTAYEQHHNVAISEEAISAAVYLSQRYIPERYLPDKAIDLLDEASAKTRIAQKPHQLHKKLKDTERKLQQAIEEKNNAVEQENFPQALMFKEQERHLREQLDTMYKKTSNAQTTSIKKVTEHDIAVLVSQITRIPVGNLVQKEVRKLQHLERSLSKSVIGQHNALNKVVRAVKRSKTGLADPRRPLASFMFLGPSGVGKTETAKTLALEIFQDEHSLLRFDMSEFAEGFNVSRLIGAPAGYVGYREGGQLTEAVRRKPYAVVLFDEVEKAHPETFNILLQVLDEGFVTDAAGKKVDFRNTIIILTSNIGLREFNEHAVIGFDAQEGSNKPNKEHTQRHIEQTVTQELHKRFRLEFLNRLDDIIIFQPLTKAHVRAIVKKELNQINSRLLQQRVRVNYTSSVVSYIAQTSFNPREGARSIRRTIQNSILSPLADTLLATHGSHAERVVTITIKNNKIVFK